MKGTLEILQSLYGEEQESEVLQRFAMINSAKCSGRDEDMSMVPYELYENCREHGLAELSELDPQLIVAQGSNARWMLELQDICEADMREHIPTSRWMWGDADVGEWIVTQAREHLKYWYNEKEEQSVLVLHVPHPSARQGQWQSFKKTMLPAMAHIVRQWLSVPGFD